MFINTFSLVFDVYYKLPTFFKPLYINKHDVGNRLNCIYNIPEDSYTKRMISQIRTGRKKIGIFIYVEKYLVRFDLYI